MNHPMSPDELKAIIRQVLREEQVIFREAIREELKDVGLVLGDKDDNREAMKDFQFLRSVREKFEGTASKVGGAVIIAVVGGFVLILWEGFKFVTRQS